MFGMRQVLNDPGVQGVPPHTAGWARQSLRNRRGMSAPAPERFISCGVSLRRTVDHGLKLAASRAQPSSTGFRSARLRWVLVFSSVWPAPLRTTLATGLLVAPSSASIST